MADASLDLLQHPRNAATGTGAVAISYAGGDQNLSKSGRGIILSTAGTLKVDMHDGSTVTFASGQLLVGVLYPLAIKKVYQTGSSAAGHVIL